MRAERTVHRLLAGEPLEMEDLVALGRLNFHAFIKKFDPVAALWSDEPMLDPEVQKILLG